MDLKFSEMINMQRQLHEKNAHKWSPLEPEYGRNTILYMVEEIGEVISVVKKKGDRAVIDVPQARDAFIEEMADVMMYFTDTLLRYHVSAEEFSEAYIQKHRKNMGRDYIAEYKEKYNG